MVHTGSVAEVQGEGRQWLAKHGNLHEGFSICPVHTGDESWRRKSTMGDPGSTPYTRG